MKTEISFFRTVCVLSALTALVSCQVAPKTASPEPVNNPAKQESKKVDMAKPVKVFIMMGQSNMVGMGDLSGGTLRWGPEFLKPVLSVYEGDYSPNTDYDKLTPVSTKELPAFGGTNPTPFPGGGVQVVRGQIQMKAAGVYEFRPGYGDSEHNIMKIGDVEVYRKEVGKVPVKKNFTFEAGKSYPFKITYLTKDANGLGWYLRSDIPGTLETLVKQENQYPFLLDKDGNWTVRNDVYYYDARTKHGSFLSPTSNGNSIGPELGFGHIIGNKLDEPVLLLKSCIGNRGLAWDLLPPGSKRFVENGKVYAGYHDKPDVWDADPAKGLDTPPPPFVDKNGKPIEWHAGKQYDEDMANAKAALADLAKIYPGYQGQGYEIAGFVWWQGHKDQSAVHASRYEQNLVNLIKSLRKDYNAPDAPFVLAVGCGNPGRESFGLQIAEAQLAMNDSKKHPEFAGNVKCVDSRDFWRAVAVSPKDQGYHYNRNAGTYMDVGLSLGQAMADLQKP